MKYTIERSTIGDIIAQDNASLYVLPFAIYDGLDIVGSGSKVGITNSEKTGGSGDAGRVKDYATSHSLTAPLIRFTFSAQAQGKIRAIERLVHAELEKFYKREDARTAKGKKSEKFYCSVNNAIAVIETVLKRL